MLNSLLNSTQISVLEKALSASSLRHKVISNNIANVNTPNFKKSEVSFEDQLKSAMDIKQPALSRTHPRHLPISPTGINVEPKIHTINTTSFRSDGNNVDIDTEMASLAKNSIYYDAVAQQINKYFAGIKSAINGGRS